MYLNAAAQALEVVLAGAVTTNQLAWSVHYRQFDSAFLLETMSPIAGLTNDTTAVPILTGLAGKFQDVKLVTVTNQDTVAAVVTLQLNISGTITPLQTQTLAPWETLVYAG